MYNIKKTLKKLLFIFSNFGYISLKKTLLIKSKLLKNYYRSYKDIKGSVDPLNRKKVCIFSHFSYDNKVADYVLYYLKDLEKSGYAIIFVSTSKSLDQASITSVSSYVSNVIIRPNIGRDVAAIPIGLEIIKKYKKEYEHLLFTNDSIYGPLSSLTPTFDLIKNPNNDVIGITDSFQGGYHLQSYFLLFSNKVFTSEVFCKFFDDLIFSNNKYLIIREYEIGLSKMLLKNDFKLFALCNYFDVSSDFYENSSNTFANSSSLKNPTHFFWDTLITKFQCPFIKRELIMDNPSRVPDVYNWKKVVKTTGYDANLIEDHIKNLTALKN